MKKVRDQGRERDSGKSKVTAVKKKWRGTRNGPLRSGANWCPAQFGGKQFLFTVPAYSNLSYSPSNPPKNIFIFRDWSALPTSPRSPTVPTDSQGPVQLSNTVTSNAPNLLTPPSRPPLNIKWSSTKLQNTFLTSP